MNDSTITATGSIRARSRRSPAQVDAWEANEVAAFLGAQPERAAEFRTLGGIPVKRVYTALDVADTPLDGHRPAGPVSVHARPLSDDVSRPPLDDAPDRRLRHRPRTRTSASST